MGSSFTKEQIITQAIENQDVSELRTALKDLTSEQIRELCKSMATVEDNQCTILHYATWQDNPDILAPLLDYADDLEIRDDFGWTPLMTAVNRGSVQNVNMLLARGAQVDCDWCGGMSLLADAMNHDNTDLILTLIEHGARVVPTAEMLSNGQEQNAFYLLHYAADDGLLDIAKILIEKGKIPLNTKNESGWTALHLAAGHNNLDMVKLLLDKGADINIRDSNGNTPLAWAKEMNGTEVLSELQKRGGIADSEWHGEKIEMKMYEQNAEEWQEGQYEEGTEGQDGQKNDGFQPGRFEIEVEDGKGRKPNSPILLDPIQRPRSSVGAVF